MDNGQRTMDKLSADRGLLAVNQNNLKLNPKPLIPEN
jgi:hypothetical protein